MILFLVVIFILGFGSSKAENETFFSIKPFLNQKTKSISVCNFAHLDQLYEELFEVSAEFQIWMNIWDCIESDIPQTQESLIILNEITPKDLQTVFSKSNIQMSITYNTWLIHVSDKLLNAYSFFDDITIKIGINAQIFIVQSLESSNVALQVIGTGLHKVEFKVSVLLMTKSFLKIITISSFCRN